MFQILVLTHGRLGEELLAAARTIAGEAPHVTALTLDWSDSYEVAREKLAAVLDGLESAEGVLILTDIYGGTPFNVAREVIRERRAEIVTGVNLPMVVRLSCLGEGDLSLEEGAEWILGKGQGAICRCTTAPPASQEPGCD